MVLQIIFNTSIENFFFHRADNYFLLYCEFIFGPTMLCGPCKVDWFESVTSLGDHFENSEEDECFQRESQGENLSWKERKLSLALWEGLL